jgi:hypothetical protein
MASTIDLPLFDSLRSSASRHPQVSQADADERFRVIAEQFVSAALDEYRHIDLLDRSARPTFEDPFDRQTAILLRERYDRWATDAEALYDRVVAVRGEGQVIAGLKDLNDAIGRTRAMLSVTLESIDIAKEQIRRGECIPLAEVRRAIRARRDA